MRTECSAALGAVQAVSGRAVVADFDGRSVTSDAGALLLGQADARVGLVDRLAACFEDHRDGRFVEHSVRTLVGQRVFGIALGYEDLIDHDVLRGDPVMAVLAGKSTLNRLELGGLSPSGDSKIVHDGSAIADLLATLFLDTHEAAPDRVVLDFNATGDLVHGSQSPYRNELLLLCFCHSSDEELHVADEEPCLRRGDSRLEILGQTPGTAQPSQCPFDDPAARQRLKAAHGVGALHDLDTPPPLAVKRGLEFRTRIGAVSEHAAQPGKTGAYRSKQLGRAIAVLDIGGDRANQKITADTAHRPSNRRRPRNPG